MRDVCAYDKSGRLGAADDGGDDCPASKLNYK